MGEYTVIFVLSSEGVSMIDVSKEDPERMTHAVDVNVGRQKPAYIKHVADGETIYYMGEDCPMEVI